jgi:hypothetical protein
MRVASRRQPRLCADDRRSRDRAGRRAKNARRCRPHAGDLADRAGRHPVGGGRGAVRSCDGVGFPVRQQLLWGGLRSAVCCDEDRRPREGPCADPGEAGPGRRDPRHVDWAGARDLVWTSPLEPEAVRFFVELGMLDARASREAWTGFVDVGSLRLPLPRGAQVLGWRVSAAARGSATYAASGWSVFAVPLS